MRNPIFAAATLAALLLAVSHAGGDEPQAESTQVIAKAKGTKEREFTPPPGFRARSSEQSDAIVRSNHMLQTFAGRYLEEIAPVGEPRCPAKN
jgi:hypothetical protein